MGVAVWPSGSKHSRLELSSLSLSLSLILSLTALVSEALVLLDPNTGRPREVATPQRKQSVFRMGFVSNLENNKVESSPIRRSDYISPSGVPLYKLRKRNPYGFGGKK